MTSTMNDTFNFAYDTSAPFDWPASAASIRRISNEDAEVNFVIRKGTVSPARRDMTKHDFVFDTNWLTMIDSTCDTEETALAKLQNQVPADVFAQLAAMVGHMRDVVWHVVADEPEGDQVKAVTLSHLEDGAFHLAAGYIHESDRMLDADLFMRGKRYMHLLKNHPVSNLVDALRILTELGMRDLALKMFVEKWR